MLPINHLHPRMEKAHQTRTARDMRRRTSSLLIHKERRSQAPLSKRSMSPRTKRTQLLQKKLAQKRLSEEPNDP